MVCKTCYEYIRTCHTAQAWARFRYSCTWIICKTSELSNTDSSQLLLLLVCTKAALCLSAKASDVGPRGNAENDSEQRCEYVEDSVALTHSDVGQTCLQASLVPVHLAGAYNLARTHGSGADSKRL